MLTKLEAGPSTTRVLDVLNSEGIGLLTLYANNWQNVEIPIRQFQGTGITFANDFVGPSRSKIDQLVQRIGKIGEKTSFALSLADRSNDLIPHVTFLEGKYEGDDQERAGIYHLIQSEAGRYRRINETLNPLIGKQLVFDQLIIGSRDILLAASRVPSEITLGRGKLRNILGDYKIEKTKPYDDIVFITLARLTKEPPRERVKHYLDLLQQLQREIRAKPLKLVLASNSITFSGNLIPGVSGKNVVAEPNVLGVTGATASADDSPEYFDKVCARFKAQYGYNPLARAQAAEMKTERQ